MSEEVQVDKSISNQKVRIDVIMKFDFEVQVGYIMVINQFYILYSLSVGLSVPDYVYNRSHIVDRQAS